LITGWGTSAEVVKGALDHYAPLAAEVQGDEILLTRKGRNLFDQVVPLVFPHEAVTIIVPPGIEVLQYRPYTETRKYERNGARKTSGSYGSAGETEPALEEEIESIESMPEPPLPPGIDVPKTMS
jgi:hypothetical protein